LQAKINASNQFSGEKIHSPKAVCATGRKAGQRSTIKGTEKEEKGGWD